MKQTADDTPESLSVFAAAAREALRLHPEIHTENFDLDAAVEFIGSELAFGMPGSVVFFWGRKFATDLLNHLGWVDDVECLIKLREAIADCFSIQDLKGMKPCEHFNTKDGQHRADVSYVLALVNPTPARVETPYVAPVAPLEKHFRELLATTYSKHGDTLPDGLFGPEYKGFGMQGPPVKFDEQAKWLALGMPGLLVNELGRDFCRHLLVEVEGAEMFELSIYLRRAVEAGESHWDSFGYLDMASEEITIPLW